MATSFFANLPYTIHNGKVAPNIAKRISLPNELSSNVFLFHKYQIEDGDRPDTIAFFYYGSPFLDWLVLLANNIIDLKNEWPLTNFQLDRVIAKEYGSIATAMNTVVHYVKNTSFEPITQSAYENLTPVIKKYWNSSVSVNGITSFFIQDDLCTISAESFSALDSSERVYWTAVSAYDNMHTLNESKRNIKLIDVQYLDVLEQALKDSMND